MPRQMRKRSRTGIYHVMVRGNERRNLFLDDEDRIRFIDILKVKGKESGFVVCGFCLMDNHIHLLINEGNEGIAKVMKKINVSYALYFNKKYKRVGHLFQDRFRSEIIEDDAYLISALRYIHNNPLKAGLVKKSADYRWSSFSAYAKQDQWGIIESETVLGIFSKNVEKAKELFLEFNEKRDEDAFIDYEDLGSEEKKASEEKEAQRIINEFIMERNITLESIKSKSNIEERNELIIKMRNQGSYSIRKIAHFLDLNRGVVQTVLGKNKAKCR